MFKGNPGCLSRGFKLMEINHLSRPDSNSQEIRTRTLPPIISRGPSREKGQTNKYIMDMCQLLKYIHISNSFQMIDEILYVASIWWWFAYVLVFGTKTKTSDLAFFLICTEQKSFKHPVEGNQPHPLILTISPWISPLLKQPRTSENILKRQEKYTNKLCLTWRYTALKPRHLSPKILVEVHVQDLPWQHMFFFWSDHRKSLQTTFRQFFWEKITLPKINIGSWRMMVGRLNDLLVCAWLVWFLLPLAATHFVATVRKRLEETVSFSALHHKNNTMEQQFGGIPVYVRSSFSIAP